ncbi:N,N-dimethylformamidase beta subunit family domain-containing protein [Aeromicrobium endophyticum]|uniref:N,N-dimethylformamidase beta subunit-like C-terminal domain-containing protein n=1 Tax=Aeromicrobium endophyticum TaxID=2292704 RepID=A0A371NZW3_9ACTN|nr:N,N-dimethylformamidase beta subunit family domain-containing protein [Aeromicrobium endophyticum]REK68880.1 hypothetical protein DX116_18635 [Aeromicrobium endophyticum]
MIPSILTSYTDRLSYEPGDPVRLFASNPSSADASVELVRIDAALDSPGKEGQTTPVDWDGPRGFRIDGQDGTFGSFMTADFIGRSTSYDALTLGALVRLSSAARPGFQAIVSVGDDEDHLTLGLLDGAVTVMRATAAGETRASASTPLHPHHWYLVAGTAGTGAGLGVHAIGLDALIPDESAEQDADVEPLTLRSAVVAGTFPATTERAGEVVRGTAASTFTGKIGWPFVAHGVVGDETLRRMASSERPLDQLGGGRLVGAWNVAQPGRGALENVTAIGGVGAGLLANLPTPGVTGHAWNGEIHHFWEAPTQYAAIHFHDTDVVDAGWAQSIEGTLPRDLPSGVYGLKVSVGDETDTVPFCVCPPRTSPANKVVVVLPTFTYLAYANEALFEGMDGEVTGGAPVHPNESDLAHVGNRTFGLSQYDKHSDGDGVVFSSASRPIVNMRHDYSMWLSESGRGFSAEMYLIEWLTSIDVPFDVITDHELHAWGSGFLSSYEVVMTGAHPEYYSGAMLDSLEQYRDEGGRIMYLGGNGFYWVTGVVSDQPLVVEIRRGHGAINAWTSEPGETGLVSTREHGGLWRHRGRAPQKLVGIGMTAQGWGGSQPYHRSEASRSPEVAWIFEGVDEEPLGAYGRVMGGAAGDELDRADATLGTPPDAVLLASSRDHSNYYQRVPEEVAFILDGQHGGQVDPEVRSDIVYFRTPSGGEVFAAGSIAYSGALLENGGHNGIARMTENVLRRFAGLPRPDGDTDDQHPSIEGEQ